MIKIGDKLPQATFLSLTDKGIEKVNLFDHLKGKKVVLFGVPAAFSTTCTKHHLASFIELADQIKAKGVDEIICVAVNDPLLLKAWEIASNVNGKITILSDWDASFAKAMGLSFENQEVGFGVRSLRYSSVVDDGILKHIEVEDNFSVCTITRADEILKHL